MLSINLELFLIYNALMDSLILAIVARVGGLSFGARFPKLRVLAAGVFGAVLCAVCVAFVYRYAVLCLAAGWSAMVFIAFGAMPARKYFRVLGMVLIFSCLLGGAGYMLVSQLGGAWTPALAVVLLVLSTFLTRGVSGIRRRAAQVPHMGTLTLDAGERGEFSFSALVDSGNNLVEPISGWPVVVISGGAFEITPDMQGFRMVPYRTVSGGGVMPCFRPRSLFMNNKSLRAYVAVSGQSAQVEALVPPAAIDEGGSGKCKASNAYATYYCK